MSWREFITFLGSVAVADPLPGLAQHSDRVRRTRVLTVNPRITSRTRPMDMVAEIRATGTLEYVLGIRGSVSLYVGRADHLAPFLGFVGD